MKQTEKVPRRLSVALLDATAQRQLGYERSAPFLLTDQGPGTLRLRSADAAAKTDSTRDYYLPYEVNDASYTTFVLWRDMKDDRLPYIFYF